MMLHIEGFEKIWFCYLLHMVVKDKFYKVVKLMRTNTFAFYFLICLDSFTLLGSLNLDTSD